MKNRPIRLRNILRYSLLFVLASVSMVMSSSLVEVALREPGDLGVLLEQGFDVTYVSPGQMADLLIHNDEDLRLLAETGLHYEFVRENIQEYLAQRLAPARDDMGGYYTLEEIENEMQIIYDDFSEIVSEPVSIGRTIEDRDIWAVKISDNPEEDEDEGEILFVSLIHAREAITSHVLIELMYLLIDNYGEDENITRYVNERQIWFVPCLNPDGYFENENTHPNGGGMHRKNMRDNGYEGEQRGVDLNRNFDYRWAYDNSGSSASPREATYRGEAAFSEPETDAIRDFVNQHSFNISIFFHSYSNLCLYPFSYDYHHADDRAVMMALGEDFTEENNYLSGTGWETIYLTNGDSDDWLYGSDEHDPILAFTIEVGSRDDNFWPPLNRKQPLIDENIPACLAAIEYSDVPERSLPPLSPLNVEYYTDRRGRKHITWETPDDEFNPPVAYNVIARLPGEDFIDEVDPDGEYWISSSTDPVEVMARSRPDCYRVSVLEPFTSLTMAKEIIAPERFEAWVRFNLTRNNNVALEVTEDGYNWIAAPGLNTQDIVEAEYNHGPGLKRIQSDNYEHYWWDLSEWEGRQVRLRFRYYRFYRAGNGDYFYIDDIGPLPGIEWEEIIAENVEISDWVDDEQDRGDGVQYFVQAVDAEGHQSFFSLPAVEGEPHEQPFEVNADIGWSIISIPFDIENLDPEVIFEEWVENESLLLLKNGTGQFFAPQFDFNQIHAWNPLEGYWIKMDGSEVMVIDAERLDVQTPIPLRQTWNIVAYLPLQQMTAEDAFQSLDGNIEFAKNDLGNFWSPEFNFNNMGNLTEGEGYLINVAEADTLVYPEENQDRVFYNETELGETPRFIQPSPFNHSLLLVSEEDWGDGEFIIRDSDNLLSGIVMISAGQRKAGLAAWGESNEGEAGLGASEEFHLFWRYAGSAAETNVDFRIVHGDKLWQDNGFTVLATSEIEEVGLPVKAEILNAYPNPFNSSVEVVFQLDRPARIRFSVFDSMGRKIDEILNESRSAGKHVSVWDGAGHPSGIYIGRVEVMGDNSASQDQVKLLMIR